MRIAIFGLGYVGAVSAACLADLGHTVVGVDPNEDKIAPINLGKSPILEKDLDVLIAKASASGMLSATTNAAEAISSCDVCFVCVGTPSAENGQLGTAYLERVCKDIGEALTVRNAPLVVVIRSTVLPGTTESLVIPLIEETSGKHHGTDFFVCFNPEFLRESTAIYDFANPPKTVVGSNMAYAAEVLDELYESLPGPKITTSIRVAEMVKYVDNCWHAVKVTFANEVGAISKSLGLDSHDVMDIFIRDEKLNLSPYYLRPGFAFGGSCLPKDLRAMRYFARASDVEVPLISSVLESNNYQIRRAANILRRYKLSSIGFVGITFKPGTDDLRESPYVELAEYLLGKGYALKIFDPHVATASLTGSNQAFVSQVLPHLGNLLMTDQAQFIGASDIIVICHGAPYARLLAQQIPPTKKILDLARISRDMISQDNYEGLYW